MFYLIEYICRKLYFFYLFATLTQIKCYKQSISNPGLSNPFLEHSLQNCHQKVWMSSLLMIIFVLSILLQKSYCEWISWHTNINMLVEFFDICCSVYYNKRSIDTTAFGWLWPGIASHAHTKHTRLDLPQKQQKEKGRRRENAWSSLHLIKRRSRGS